MKTISDLVTSFDEIRISSIPAGSVLDRPGVLLAVRIGERWVEVWKMTDCLSGEEMLQELRNVQSAFYRR